MSTLPLHIAPALLFAALAVGAAGGQSLISNGSFDTDIDGWTLTGGGPESTITWDGANGSPLPGALRMTSTLVPAQETVLEALGDCVNGTPGEILSATGKVMEPVPQFGVTCYVFLVLYDGADCTGSRTFAANAPPNTPGVWEDSGFEINIPAAGISARPSLTMELRGAGAGEKSCLYDSVLFQSDSRGTPISDVPALSWPGLLVLSLLMAATATALLVRGRGLRV